MRVLARNLKDMERRVSPTSHATILLMHTQEFIRQLLNTPKAVEPTGALTICVLLSSNAFVLIIT